LDRISWVFGVRGAQKYRKYIRVHRILNAPTTVCIIPVQGRKYHVIHDSKMVSNFSENVYTRGNTWFLISRSGKKRGHTADNYTVRCVI